MKFGPIYNGVALSDPRRDPVYGYCQANNLPLTLQRGTTFARNAPIDLGRAIHVEPVALRYPDLTIMLAYKATRGSKTPSSSPASNPMFF